MSALTRRLGLNSFLKHDQQKISIKNAKIRVQFIEHAGYRYFQLIHQAVQFT